MPGSSARQVALTLAVGAVVAGCSSDGDKPQTLPTISASPSVEASPAPSAPPASATGDASAAAFVRKYYDQVNQAASTGRTDRVTAMTVANCPCRALTKYIDDAYSKGSLRGFIYTIRSVKTETLKGRSALVGVLYSVGRIEEVNKRGDVIGVVPPVSNGQKSVTVVRTENGWLIYNVQNLSK